MLGELGRDDWLEILGIPIENIPQILILRGTRNLKYHYEIFRKLFVNGIEIGSPNRLIEDVLIGEWAGIQVAYASVYGAAMASEITHMFGMLGTKLVIQSGCCGAWANGIQAGDLFVPTKAFCGEGAAQYYVGNKQVVTPSLEIAQFELLLDELKPYRGGIYTTAALFQENRKEIEQWASEGWEAVDMETAATLAVAEHFGMDSLSLLFAFDNPRQHHDILVNEHSKDQRRREGNEAMMNCIFHIVKHYSSGLNIS